MQMIEMAHGEAARDPVEVENRRLKTLVAELLMANQELRFKAAALETETESLKHGLANATAWAGMLF